MFYKLIGYGLIALLIAVLGASVQSIIENWGHVVARAVAMGFIAGCVLYQVAHRVRYGKWFEISDTNPTDRRNNRQL